MCTLSFTYSKHSSISYIQNFRVYSLVQIIMANIFSSEKFPELIEKILIFLDTASTLQCRVRGKRVLDPKRVLGPFKISSTLFPLFLEPFELSSTPFPPLQEPFRLSSTLFPPSQK